jgi:hypothetical protein
VNYRAALGPLPSTYVQLVLEDAGAIGRRVHTRARVYACGMRVCACVCVRMGCVCVRVCACVCVRVRVRVRALTSPVPDRIDLLASDAKALGTVLALGPLLCYPRGGHQVLCTIHTSVCVVGGGVEW